MVPHTSSEAISHADAVRVREALDDVLLSVPFRNTRQCQSLLKYIVEHTLAGENDLLRERGHRDRGIRSLALITSLASTLWFERGRPSCGSGWRNTTRTGPIAPFGSTSRRAPTRQSSNVCAWEASCPHWPSFSWFLSSCRQASSGSCCSRAVALSPGSRNVSVPWWMPTLSEPVF